MAHLTPPNPLPPNDNIGPMLTVVSYVFIFPSVITTALRLGFRAQRKALGWDDYTMAVATALAVVLSALSIEGVDNGKGRHRWYLTKGQIARVTELSWINQIILFSALCLIKTSICLLFMRIQNGKRLRWFLCGVIALMTVSTLEAIIALLAECQPVHAFWNRAAGKCRGSQVRIYSIYVQAGVSMLTDLICSITPIFIVRKLQMPLKRKVLLCVLMALGLVATAFAGVRASSLGTSTVDTTYDYTYAGTWSTIETNLGIIAANLALAPGFWGAVRGRADKAARSPIFYWRSPQPDPNRTMSSLGQAQPKPLHGPIHVTTSLSVTSDRSQVPLKDLYHVEDNSSADGDHRSKSEAPSMDYSWRV